jgi:hypothetical protein
MVAADLGEEAAQFFTEYLGVPSRLVYKSPNDKRAVVEHSPGVNEIGFVPEVNNTSRVERECDIEKRGGRGALCWTIEINAVVLCHLAMSLTIIYLSH